MTIFQQVKKHWALSFAIILLSVFWLLRNSPGNQKLDFHDSQKGGDYKATVYRLYAHTVDQLNDPQTPPASYFIYHGYNPGLFKAVLVFTLKAGAKNYAWAQVIASVITLLGLVFFYFWVRILFESDALANIAVIILALTPFLPYYGSVLHHHPYSFFGFNLAVWGAAKFAKTDQKKWFAVSVAGYIVACLNYWMFYIPGFLIPAGIFWRQKGFKKSFPYMFILGSAAVLSVFFIVSMAAVEAGGYDKVFSNLVMKGAARTLDIKTDDNPVKNKSYLPNHSLRKYFVVVNDRMSNFWFFSIDFYLFLFLISVALSLSDIRKKYFLFLFIIPAGVSWFIVMMQHTTVHPFSAIYGFYCWSLILANYANEAGKYTIHTFLRVRAKNAGKHDVLRLIAFSIFNAVALGVFLSGVNQGVIKNLSLYLHN